MINVSKQLFYGLLIAFLCVVITLCIVAAINRDTDQLIQNVSLAMTTIIGFFIRYDEDDAQRHESDTQSKDDDPDDWEDIF